MELPLIYTTAIFILIPLVLGAVIYARSVELKFKAIIKDFEKRNTQLRDRIYELSILQEISKSISYALNIERVADIIAGSLGDILEYNVSSYLLYSKGELKFKAFLRNSVSADYIKQLQTLALEELHTYRKLSFKSMHMEDSISGAIINNSLRDKVQSISHIPLYINKKVVGLISISSVIPNAYSKNNKVELISNISKQAMAAVENLQKLLILEKGKLSTMVETLADGVFFIDDKMKVLVSNTSARKMLGLTKEENSVLDIVEKLEGVDIKDKIDQALNLKKSFVIPEVKIRGKYLKVLLSQVPGTKEALGVVLLIQDVTSQIELEKMREDFTSMMVHDLRAPLTVMAGSSDILIKRDADLKPEQKTQLLFDIKKGAYSLLEIVNDLLDVAKMEHGKFELHPEVLDINAFIANKSEYYRSIMEERGLSFVVDVPKEGNKVNFDENLIGRVLSNLLSNANKFTKEGTVSVTLEKLADNKFIKVSVKDTGVGISKASQKHLFNKFEQLRNPVDSKQKGTGLGLVITKNIVKEHGGDIGVESDEGKGSTFWFTLPIYQGKSLDSKIKS